MECGSDTACQCEIQCKDEDIGKDETCDCSSPNFPVWPTVIGIIGALLILIFWHRQIVKLCRKYKYNGTLHPHMRDEPPPSPPQRRNAPEEPQDRAWDAPPPYNELSKNGPQTLPSGISVIASDNPPSYSDVMKMDEEAKIALVSHKTEQGLRETSGIGQKPDEIRKDVDVERQ